MLFNTFQFIWLFPLIFCIRIAINATQINEEKLNKIENFLLIAISYGLYLQWKPVYSLILLGVTLITYLSALIIEKHIAHKKKAILFPCVFLTILPLIIFKYYNFLNENLTALLNYIGISGNGLPGLNWVMPLGISFFTFQSLSYLFDVYYNRIPAEKKWWDYMLFVCFFPQIACGPISRAKDLLPQIKTYRRFDEKQAIQGLKWLLWGMFLKVVMADRIGIYVNSIFDNYEYQNGISCIIGSILYTFQIYGDFAGYSFMALGVGELMGFELPNNFKRPYLSQSITEFWHRWHISLSTWLKDYVYIPLGGSRCSKLRSYWNIIVTFLVSGIWHGANWTFIVWGLIHGIFQVLEKILNLQKPNSKGILKFLRISSTFIIVNLAWVFFRMPTLTDGLHVIKKMCVNHSGSIAYISPSMKIFIVLSLVIVIIKDLMDEFLPKGRTLFYNKSVIIRWTSYVSIVILILLCGVFDASQFIYVNF